MSTTGIRLNATNCILSSVHYPVHSNEMSTMNFIFERHPSTSVNEHWPINKMKNQKANTVFAITFSCLIKTSDHLCEREKRNGSCQTGSASSSNRNSKIPSNAISATRKTSVSRFEASQLFLRPMRLFNPLASNHAWCNVLLIRSARVPLNQNCRQLAFEFVLPAYGIRLHRWSPP